MRNYYVLLAFLIILFSCEKQEVIEDKFLEMSLKDSVFVRRKSLFDRVSYDRYNYLGSGYDVTGDYANANSTAGQVIDIEKFKKDYSTRLLVEKSLSQSYVEEYGENAMEYSRKISNKVGLSGSFFKGLLTASFSYSTTTNNKFDARYIYGSYDFIIKQKRLKLNVPVSVLVNYLTDDFKQDLYIFNAEEIVSLYGTHVLVDIYIGAKMDIKFQSETTNQSREYASRVGVKVGVKSVFDAEVSSDLDLNDSKSNFNKKLSYRTRGGDPSIGLVGQINLDRESPRLNLSNWQNSVTPENSVLVDFGSRGLVKIYDLIPDLLKKQQVKQYVDNYLNKNQIEVEYSNPLGLKNGDFVRNRNTGEVFFIFEGTLRYIESPDTLFGLFNMSESVIRNVEPRSLTGMLRGKNLSPDNDLRQDVATWKIYLREGRYLRHILNKFVYDKYRFNDSAIRRIYGTSGYQIGNPIRE
ncbi:MAC/perforin domain-containing protein [Capnocytophaga cynodegmi]|uniref:MAC/perforin domain-containing protein n=1 Tax=Capnocytophaga cynodegmi TaxID=28189 RepID=UPI00385F3DDE